MRWIKKQKGDTRIRRGFLWFPKTIGKESRWWEYAVWLEELDWGAGINKASLVWCSKEWLNNEESIGRNEQTAR